jgi:hypothetical protein
MLIPELYFLPPDVVALAPEQDPLPLWLRLGLAGALTVGIAVALTLS